MKVFKNFIKEQKVPYKYLSDETGYSTVYISQILNGHLKPSFQFKKLITLALRKFTDEQKAKVEKGFPDELNGDAIT